MGLAMLQLGGVNTLNLRADRQLKRLNLLARGLIRRDRMLQRGDARSMQRPRFLDVLVRVVHVGVRFKASYCDEELRAEGGHFFCFG